MRSPLIKITFLFALVAVLSSFSLLYPDPPVADEDWKAEVKWYTWDEAIEANKVEKKKIMIDLYTSWCGWCKVMDKKTFGKKDIANYLNENFYPVKFNAEQKEEIVFNGHTFKYMKNGRRGVHALAYSLLEGQLSYPAIVFMDADIQRITISKGYTEAKPFMTQLKFVAEEHYKNTSYQEFEKSMK